MILIHDQVENQCLKMMKIITLLSIKKKKQHPTLGTSPVTQWLRLCVSNAGGLGLIPSGEARSHRPQLGVLMLQLKILHTATKT